VWKNNYYVCESLADIQAGTNNLVNPINPLGLILITIVFTAVFCVIAYLTAVSRARNYNIEELDDELLVSLGVSEDMLVLEEGRNQFNVAISGPDVNAVDFHIQVPAMTAEYQAAGQPARSRQTVPDYEEPAPPPPSARTGRAGRKGKKGGAGIDDKALAQYEEYDDE